VSLPKFVLKAGGDPNEASRHPADRDPAAVFLSSATPHWDFRDEWPASSCARAATASIKVATTMLPSVDAVCFMFIKKLFEK
jgi:hypothetical protein